MSNPIGNKNQVLFKNKYEAPVSLSYFLD